MNITLSDVGLSALEADGPVLVTGGIDISVGAVTALVCMCCAVNLDYQGGNILSAVLIALGIGVLFGVALFQAILVMSTALPVMKKVRAGQRNGGGVDQPEAHDGSEAKD